MTDAEQREAARKFINKWHGYEKGETSSFWISLLSDVLGVPNATDYIQFEKQVNVDGQTKFIDGYIPATRVLIEQKSSKFDLDTPEPQSGIDKLMTPYEQANRYNNYLNLDEKAKWIVTCNFSEIRIYNMNKLGEKPQILHLDNLQNEYRYLDFLVKEDVKEVKKEEELSIKAGEIVGKIYNALRAQYNDSDSEETLKSLNALCVRLVFCLYAEDAGVFGEHLMFYNVMKDVPAQMWHTYLKSLFEMLNPPYEDRKGYDKVLEQFPYINGGLFSEVDSEIPAFTPEIVDLILEEGSRAFDWKDIDPTIFGAVFESTLNPETRRSGGMHYTSVENIHKVIDPLFLDDLKKELEECKAAPSANGVRTRKLKVFQDKLASLTFLDPACGSGNFLTETYMSLRRMENEVLAMLGTIEGDQITAEGFGSDFFNIKVSISQFYGIEINDFAVSVAKTAMWIAEAQMMAETKRSGNISEDFLPLKTNANIIEGNALRINWEDVVPKEKLNYIMGNPPFVGYSNQSKEQKKDILSIYVDENGKPYKAAGKIDYVSGWYFKAAELVQGSEIRTAFVSTNSITQGEQVAGVWKPLFDRFGIHIDFAWRTFRWDSEASIKAHVHCVIVGFSVSEQVKPRMLFDKGEEDNSNYKECDNINPYLIDAPNTFIQSRNKPLCRVPKMTTGNRPADGGHLIIEANDYDNFIQKEPKASKYIKRLMGSEEFINGKKRYCLWLVDVSPTEIREMPHVLERIEKCKLDRLKGAPDRQKLAETPTLFRETKNPKSYIIIPKVSSERRRYIPLGFMDDSTIPTDLNFIVPNAKLYELGVLCSNVHMAWMRAVAGRLKSDYRYSKDIVYNNFPWPSPTEEQKTMIEKTAQGILDARELYPDSSLADLYDELTMPIELRKAHQANDRAVMKAYGFDVKTMSEADCVAELMKMYQELTKNEK